MIDFDAIRKVIVKGLKDYLKVSIIRSNQTGELPAYPYGSYTITTPLSANKGTWGKYEDGIDRKPTTQTFSLTFQSDDMSEALSLTIKAHNWLDHVGREYLADNGIIVQSLTDIANRDNMLTIEYEHRNGFDFVIWMLQTVKNPDEQTGYIEIVKVNEEEYSSPTTTHDKLNGMLESRLRGDSDGNT